VGEGCQIIEGAFGNAGNVVAMEGSEAEGTGQKVTAHAPSPAQHPLLWFLELQCGLQVHGWRAEGLGRKRVCFKTGWTQKPVPFGGGHWVSYFSFLGLHFCT
jgi:hypothetical protein